MEQGRSAMIDIGNRIGRKYSELWYDLTTMEKICLIDFWVKEDGL